MFTQLYTILCRYKFIRNDIAEYTILFQHRNTEFYKDNKLIDLINNPILLENTATNGYEKFLKIYDKTKVDFEEFIAFDKKHSNIEHLFNLYANQGTFAHIIQDNEQNPHRLMQEMLHLILGHGVEFLVYKRLCELQSTKVSLFQIYNYLKSFTKISKDKLYAITASLVEQKLLFWVEKYNAPHFAKKVYAIDFAFKNAISFKKDFPKRFENMVFLELNARGYEVFYTDEAGFFVPELEKAIVTKAFAITDDEKKLAKLSKKAWEIGRASCRERVSSPV